MRKDQEVTFKAEQRENNMDELQKAVANIAVDEQTIIIALDASNFAEHAVNWYLSHVHRPGNRLVFVHCIELPEMKVNQARSLHMSPGVLASMWKEAEKKTKDLEQRIKLVLKDKGLSGVLRTASGKPGEVICRIAEEEDAAMIVTGARGMGKIRRTILGSVTDYLVHHSICPVIVCRHPDAIEKQLRRRHSSSSTEGSRSRHTSGESNPRSRNPSGKFMGRSQSVSSDVFEEEPANVNQS